MDLGYDDIAADYAELIAQTQAEIEYLSWVLNRDKNNLSYFQSQIDALSKRMASPPKKAIGREPPNNLSRKKITTGKMAPISAGNHLRAKEEISP